MSDHRNTVAGGPSLLIPDGFVRELQEVQWSDNLFRRMFPAPEPVPLTWRQKVRVFRAEVGGRLHDFLFPECENRDDW